jgi:multidrug efflux system membrane fusion protein
MTDSSLPAPAKTGRRKSIIGTTLALLVLAALAGLAWYLTHRDTGGFGGPGGRRGMPPTTVGVAAAERTDMPVYLDALGTATATATATVRPQVSGVLQTVRFNEGQAVHAGQVLATIDPRPFEMALKQATGQLQRDEAQLENAIVTLARYRSLQKLDSIAQQDVDTQAALVKQLKGTVEADRAAEGTAKLNLGYTKITAPIAGRAGLRMVDIGNIVNPGDANGIVVITQVSPIDVGFTVPQDRIPELQAQLAQNSALAVTALDRTRANTLATGQFLALDNQIDTQTGTVRAKARFANADFALYPNQFVNVRLLMNTIKNAIVIPVNALRHGSNSDFVFVLNPAERTVSQRTVTRGQGTVDKVEITSGLQAGEQVITEGADRLKDGSRVMLQGDKPAAGGKGNKGGNRGQPGGASAGTASIGVPTREQQQRMLDEVKDDPAALARRKTFFEKLEKGDPEAMERWRQIVERGRQGAQQASPQHGEPAGASSSAHANASAGASAGTARVGIPTLEQQQHMLDEVKDDPAALARRKAFFEKLNKGEPEAIERWRQILEQRRQGNRPSSPSGEHAGANSGPGANASGNAASVPLPTPEQQQQMLDKVKDDPEALAKRKAFFEKLNRGDPEAIERWRQILEQRRQGAQPSSK